VAGYGVDTNNPYAPVDEPASINPQTGQPITYAGIPGYDPVTGGLLSPEEDARRAAELANAQPGAGSTTTGGTTGPNTPDSGAVISSADVLTQGAEMAQQGIPLQLGGLLDSLAQLRARATGSTADILPGIIDQLASLRSGYAGATQAIAKRLGFAGGGQTVRASAADLAQATQAYQALIQQGQQKAQADIINVEGKFQPLLSGAARAPNVGVRTSPFNAAGLGAGLAGAAGGIGAAAKGISKFFQGSDTSTPQEAADAVTQLRQTTEAADVPASLPETETLPVDTAVFEGF
jgi:hypothetical protein